MHRLISLLCLTITACGCTSFDRISVEELRLDPNTRYRFTEAVFYGAQASGRVSAAEYSLETRSEVQIRELDAQAPRPLPPHWIAASPDATFQPERAWRLQWIESSECYMLGTLVDGDKTVKNVLLSSMSISRLDADPPAAETPPPNQTYPLQFDQTTVVVPTPKDPYHTVFRFTNLSDQTVTPRARGGTGKRWVTAAPPHGRGAIYYSYRSDDYRLAKDGIFQLEVTTDNPPSSRTLSFDVGTTAVSEESPYKRATGWEHLSEPK